MKTETLFWLGALIVFFLIFVYAYISYRLGTGVIDIMPPKTEDAIVMGFSVLGIFKSIYEIR